MGKNKDENKDEEDKSQKVIIEERLKELEEDLRLIEKILNLFSKKYNFATHISKITHSGSSANSVVCKEEEPKEDGFLHTNNIETEHKLDVAIDGKINSTFFKLFEFSEQDLNKKVVDVLLDKLKSIESELKNTDLKGVDLKKVKYKGKKPITEVIKLLEGDRSLEEKVKKLKSNDNEILVSDAITEDENPETDHLVKQVYFPISEEKDDYHVLSVMSPVLIMAELKNHIQKLTKEEYIIPSSIEISFGGSNAQNISHVTSKCGGTFTLLPTLVPFFNPSKIILPKRNFFNECLRDPNIQRDLKVLFTSLCKKVVEKEKHNKEIREERDKIIRDVIHDVYEGVESVASAIQSQDARWSEDDKYRELPEYQKTWLDSKYHEERKSKYWKVEICDEFARWFIREYEYVNKKSILGDEDLEFIRRFIKKDGRLFKNYE